MPSNPPLESLGKMALITSREAARQALEKVRSQVTHSIGYRAAPVDSRTVAYEFHDDVIEQLFRDALASSQSPAHIGPWPSQASAQGE